MDVVNDGIYKHVKAQCEIISSLDYTKIKKNVCIWE